MQVVKQPRPQRVQIALWVLVMVLFFAITLYTYGLFQVGAYDDDASYAVLAQSFFSGTQYGLINVPGEPGTTRWPFGYPLLLAPLALFSPSVPFTLAILSLVATAASGVLLFWGWRTYSPSTSYWWGLMVTALFLLAPLTVSHTQMVMSEAVFTLCVLAAILLSLRIEATRLSLSTWLALSVLLVFVLFVRTVGFILLVAVFLAWGLKWRAHALRPILAVIGGMVLVTAVIVLVTVVRPVDLIPSEYLQMFHMSTRSIPGNAGIAHRLFLSMSDYLFLDGRRVILPLGTGTAELTLTTRLGVPWLTALSGLVLFALVVAGMWLWFRREGFGIPLLFAVIYLPSLVVWSVPATRFFHPVQPQIFLAFLFSVNALTMGVIHFGHIPPRVGYAAIGTIVGVLCVLYLVKAANMDASNEHTGDLPTRTRWVRANAEPNAVIISAHPEVDYLYGNHKTESYLALDAPDPAGQLRYVLVAPDIVWQDKFSPLYDDDTKNVWSELQAWAQQGKARLEYQDTANAIRVYKLTP